MSDAPVPSRLPIGGPSLSLFFFADPPQMWTCGQATVNWEYDGAIGELTLSVTNEGVDQSAAPPSPSSSSPSSSPAAAPSSSAIPAPITDGTPTSAGALGPGGARPSITPLALVRRQFASAGVISQTLVDNLDPGVRNWTWPQVDVPQGWYVMHANILNTNPSSAPFFVHNGTDTSCVRAASPPSSSSSSSSAAGASGSPVVGAAQKSSHAGAIAGGVVGGVLGALLLALLAFWFLRRRRAGAHGRKRSTESGLGRWAGGKKQRGAHASFGSSVYAGEGAPAGTTEHTPAGSDEGLGSIAEEKAVAHAPTNALENTVPYHHDPAAASKRSSAASSVSNFRVRGGGGGGGAEGALSFESARSSSGGGHARPAAYRHSVGADGEMIPLERSGTGRRSQRKPVPRYSQEEFAAGSSAESARASPLAGAPAESMPGLHHQSSFGARPMREMMPDMPPPPARG